MTNSYFRQVPNLEYVNRNSNAKDISNYITVKNLFKRGRLRPDIFQDLTYFEKYSIVGDDRPDNVAQKYYDDPTLDWLILLSNNITNIQSEWPLPQSSLDEFLLEKYGTYDKLHSGIHHYETVEIKNTKGAVILEGGLQTPKTWKTNGNFIQAINTKINQISGTESKIATVTMNNGIKNLEVGSEVLIQGVSEATYNGRFPITEILSVGDVVIRFTYVLPSIPEKKTYTPNELSGSEEVIFTVLGSVGAGNAYYYEYFDKGSYHTIPVANVVKAITNYDYELSKENKKRDIFILKNSYLNVIFNDMDEIMPYKKGAAQYVNSTLKKGENIRLYS
tara:strand:+ start:524 stop:1525 length:1002 start_codon:yes stop_codon:yes gene_type:complete